jgi:hypothetical protein
MDDNHPILGNIITNEETSHGAVGKVYTRTVVLWAFGITMDPQLLWQNVEVRDRHDGPVITNEEELCPTHPEQPSGKIQRHNETHRRTKPGVPPVVRMMTNATKRRGYLLKRMRCTQSFRSVLSMDVEYNGFMPNLKISGRNTLQVTGAQDIPTLGDILKHLIQRYNGKGIVVHNPICSGFVGDVVLANVHFKLNFRLDRAKLRDIINAERGPFIASYEPLVRDVSVSLKHVDDSSLPNDGSVYPRWTFNQNKWDTVTLAEATQLVPHINIKGTNTRITSLRVFQSGSVIIVSRWPVEMGCVYRKFRDNMDRFRPNVLDAQFAKQRTIESCWGKPEE